MHNNSNLRISHLIFITAFCVSLFKICSYDIFWHIKIGEYILENYQIISKNTFSFTFPEHSWTPTYWLFEVIVFLIYKNFGLNGLIIFKAVIAGISFSLIANYFSKTVKNIWILYFFLIAAIDLTIFRLILRPHIFTFLGFSMLIILINEIRKKEINSFILFKFTLLFLIWSNLHSGVIFGILMLVIFIFSNEIQYLLFNKDKCIRKTSQKNWLFLILIFSFAATLVTPSGINLYRYVFDHAKIDSVILLEEFSRLTINNNMKQIVSISFFAILPIIILFIEKRITVFNIGIFIFGILLINKGIRFIPDSIFILTPNFIESFSAREYLSNCSFFKHRKYFVLLAILYICHVHFLSYKDKSSSFISGFGINKKALPVEASLKLNPLKDRIFNSFSIGGYLIWKFDGKLKVFQDGRIHAYPFYFFNEINDACNDEDLWFLLLNKYNINTVILDKSESSLSQMTSLKKNSWKYRYEDENFIVASKHEI